MHIRISYFTFFKISTINFPYIILRKITMVCFGNFHIGIGYIGIIEFDMAVSLFEKFDFILRHHFAREHVDGFHSCTIDDKVARDLQIGDILVCIRVFGSSDQNWICVPGSTVTVAPSAMYSEVGMM